MTPALSYLNTLSLSSLVSTVELRLTKFLFLWSLQLYTSTYDNATTITLFNSVLGGETWFMVINTNVSIILHIWYHFFCNITQKQYKITTPVYWGHCETSFWPLLFLQTHHMMCWSWFIWYRCYPMTNLLPTKIFNITKKSFFDNANVK